MPPETTYWSPYSGLDALCGNTLLLPIDELLAMGLLAAGEVPEEQPVELNADFPAVAEWKVRGSCPALAVSLDLRVTCRWRGLGASHAVHTSQGC